LAGFKVKVVYGYRTGVRHQSRRDKVTAYTGIKERVRHSRNYHKKHPLQGGYFLSYSGFDMCSGG
jgi:hypothetical protein